MSSLSSDIVSLFVKATNDKTETKKETTVYGTTVEYNGSIYVKLDGSDLLTPVSTTANVKADERVTVMIKDHTATVTGNLTSPSASSSDVKDVADQISEFEIVMVYKVSATDLEAINATIESLRAKTAYITDAEILNAEIRNLEAKYAELEYVDANVIKALDADIEKLKSMFAEIGDLTVEELDAINADINNLKAYNADFTYVSADVLEAMKASIKELDVKKLTAEQADLKYANIDFSNIQMAAVEELFTKSGIIKDLVVGDQSITGELVGVTIRGDIIEGGTVIADKLVVKGEDGIYYKLNTEGGAVPDEEITKEKLQNGLHGSVIIAKSITAEKVNVHDLVAFGATIGGFHITDSSLYSGAKASVDNTTRGIYLDDTGQMALGDSTHYLRYFQDEDGGWKLEITAKSITLGGGNKTVEESITDIEKEMSTIESTANSANNKINNLDIGTRNLLQKSSVVKYIGEWLAWRNSTMEIVDDSWLKITKDEAQTSCGGYPPKISNLPVAGNYIISFDAYSNSATSLNYNYIMDSNGNTHLNNVEISSTPKRVTLKFKVTEAIAGCSIMIGTSSGDEFYIKDIKLELGNVATDWTPAPEDVDEVIDNAQDTADQAHASIEGVNARIDVNEDLITNLASQIANLVTDGTGASLMTQTPDGGWSFNIANFDDKLNTTSKDLADLLKNVDNVETLINELKKTVGEHGADLEYVRITTFDGQPCIELGEGDSDFKLRITNTAIHFVEGSDIPAWITNQALHIKKAVIENEMQIGGFVWVKRSNGNLGLMWKGDSI